MGVGGGAQIAPPGAFRPGWSEVAFSVRPKYDPNGPGVLYETYHGVNINIQYGISAEVCASAVVGLQPLPWYSSQAAGT
jgi:hypothetical protein